MNSIADLKAKVPAPSASDLDTFLIIVEQYELGTHLTVETLRSDLDAAQISPSSYGSLFLTACRRGYLAHTGRTVIERKATRRGGRAGIYKRTRPKQETTRPPLTSVKGGRR